MNIRPDSCPRCKCVILAMSEGEIEDDERRETIECSSCHFRWVEVWKFDEVLPEQAEKEERSTVYEQPKACPACKCDIFKLSTLQEDQDLIQTWTCTFCGLKWQNWFIYTCTNFIKGA